jgi:hypothetical protein
MGLHDDIDAGLADFITRQHMFFVATAPLDGTGHVNVSPKGLETFRILDRRTVAYLDYVGSGAETIAHLRENGRLTFMFCAFDGPPKILRLYARGEVVEPQDPAYGALAGLFREAPSARSIIRATVHRVATSCGFGVPLMTFESDRPQIGEWADRKGPAGIRQYQRDKNGVSLDGLPALRWVGEVQD